ELAGHLLPWARRGLAVAAPSGALLFITQATQLGRSPVFEEERTYEKKRLTDSSKSEILHA
ncbi:hypothetical protein ACLESO_19090, partial [Pyxidicoccus sp. 3LG]